MKIHFHLGISAALCAAALSAPAQTFLDVADASLDAIREGREQNAAPTEVRAIFAKAKNAADDDDKLNLCGFYTGMSKADATTLGNYYKLKPGEFETEGDPVYEIKLSLKGLRRVTKGGNTFDELAQAVANRIGDLSHDYEYDTWRIATIDDIHVSMSERDGFEMVDYVIRRAAWEKNRKEREAAERSAQEERERKAREERKAIADNIIRNFKNGTVQFWKDGPYWATKNIGAEESWESGLYFWWGDTVGYRREGDAWVASDGSSSSFSFAPDNAPTDNKDIATLQREGWIVSKAGSYVLAPQHDAAHVHWGGAWRMPTDQEFKDLKDKCDWKWTTMNGVKGYIVSGKDDYASASIFLPATGHGLGTSLDFAGSFGSFLSSVPDESNSDFVWYLLINSDFYRTFNNSRFGGLTIRPVQEGSDE